jgi:hypothetical protein
VDYDVTVPTDAVAGVAAANAKLASGQETVQVFDDNATASGLTVNNVSCKIILSIIIITIVIIIIKVIIIIFIIVNIIIIIIIIIIINNVLLPLLLLLMYY